MKDVKARAWFGTTALVVLFGLVVQVAVAANNDAGHFTTVVGRVFNVFCFFTIQSNVLVGITSLLLAVDPARSSTVFAVFRLIAFVAIVITGIVYHSVLRGLLDLESWALVADHIIHTVVPIMAVVGWLVFGPRGQLSWRIAWLSVIFPICWMVFTMIRGEIVDYYPYPFVNVNAIGYAKVAVNSVWVAALYLGVASGATLFDRWLTRTTTERSDRTA